MSATAGAQIPITRTFIQGTVTTAIPLVGQVLYNGETNWVGYDSGYADYLLTASAAGAVETTLADGHTYYFSSGTAPAGITLLTGTHTTAAASSSQTGTGATTTGATTGTGSSSSRVTTTDTSSSQTGSATASPATTTSSAQRLSSGAVFSIGLALLATLSLNILA